LFAIAKRGVVKANRFFRKPVAHFRTCIEFADPDVGRSHEFDRVATMNAARNLLEENVPRDGMALYMTNKNLLHRLLRG
jgi:hypothetical protein